MTYPIIGVTLDHEAPGGYSKFPWYALRENYAGAVIAAGGLPWPLAHDLGQVEALLERLDGLVITGGAFDVDPSLFGAGETHDTVVTKDRRTKFEWAMAEGMLKQDKPVLGICGGQQLLNVILGGSLIQHIPDSVPDCLAHEQPNPRDEAGHDVTVVADSLLGRIAGMEALSVNSAHHQAVDRVGPDVLINATAPDGVIEGIEHPAYKFCLGVQWHPEFHISSADAKIFDAFLKACRS
jgi:putative glutamine amidotransferase